MDSANFHQQQHQNHQILDPSCYGLSWTRNPLNSSTSGTDMRDLKQHQGIEVDLVSCHNTSTSMVHGLGLNWNTTNNSNVTSNPIENFTSHELQRSVAGTKDEFSGSESYPNLLEMISSSPTSSVEDLHLNPSPGYINNRDLLLNTFSNGCQINDGQLMDQFQDENHEKNCSRTIQSSRTFSQIFPTINISSSNQSSAAVAATLCSNSFDMNLPGLDLFGSPRFNGNFNHPSSFNPHQLGSFFKDTCLSYGLDQMHQPNHSPLICPNKISSASNNGTRCSEVKRPATDYMDTKTPQASVPKKSKLEPRATCTPFKVRKEKLGDRIAVLQQLVAPFGKTDTASVLMEAIGYINFLQSQVETLSVPYMKPTQKTSRTSTRWVLEENQNDEEKRDLKSRGLCLVPLSCLSYVSDGVRGVWPTP